MHYRKTIALILGTTAIAACNGDPGIPNDPSALDGLIVARSAATMHVKENPAAPCGVVFRIDSQTNLLQRTATGRIEKATADDFVVGAEVRVWAGAIAESCPGQALATTIELLP